MYSAHNLSRKTKENITYSFSFFDLEACRFIVQLFKTANTSKFIVAHLHV